VLLKSKHSSGKTTQVVQFPWPLAFNAYMYMCVCPSRSLYMITLSVPRHRRCRRYRCRAYSGLWWWKKIAHNSCENNIRFGFPPLSNNTPLHCSCTCTVVHSLYIYIYIGVYRLQYTSYYVATRVRLYNNCVNCRRRGNITVRVYIILCGVSIYANKKKKLFVRWNLNRRVLILIFITLQNSIVIWNGHCTEILDVLLFLIIIRTIEN